MCSIHSSPRGAYPWLPATEPCFLYRCLPLEDDLPDLPDTFEFADIDAAFPDEFENKAVEFLFVALCKNERLEDRDEPDWHAVNWGFIDRLIGPWAFRRGWHGIAVGLKRLVGIRSRGARSMEEAMRKHLWTFTRDKAVREIRAALQRLIDGGEVRKTDEHVEEFGPMTFYWPTPSLIHRLISASRTRTTS
jgi:hypothetical protein